jgi:hypothetical protein
MSASKAVLLGVLGYTAYTIAVCPCKQIAACRRNEFLLLTSIPVAFALYNFAVESSCSGK